MFPGPMPCASPVGPRAASRLVSVETMTNAASASFAHFGSALHGMSAFAHEPLPAFGNGIECIHVESRTDQVSGHARTHVAEPHEPDESLVQRSARPVGRVDEVVGERRPAPHARSGAVQRGPRRAGIVDGSRSEPLSRSRGTSPEGVRPFGSGEDGERQRHRGQGFGPRSEAPLEWSSEGGKHQRLLHLGRRWRHASDRGGGTLRSRMGRYKAFARTRVDSLDSNRANRRKSRKVCVCRRRRRPFCRFVARRSRRAGIPVRAARIGPPPPVRDTIGSHGLRGPKAVPRRGDRRPGDHSLRALFDTQRPLVPRAGARRAALPLRPREGRCRRSVRVELHASPRQPDRSHAVPRDVAPLARCDHPRRGVRSGGASPRGASRAVRGRGGRRVHRRRHQPRPFLPPQRLELQPVRARRGVPLRFGRSERELRVPHRLLHAPLRGDPRGLRQALHRPARERPPVPPCAHEASPHDGSVPRRTPHCGATASLRLRHAMRGRGGIPRHAPAARRRPRSPPCPHPRHHRAPQRVPGRPHPDAGRLGPRSG